MPAHSLTCLEAPSLRSSALAAPGHSLQVGGADQGWKQAEADPGRPAARCCTEYRSDTPIPEPPGAQSSGGGPARPCAAALSREQSARPPSVQGHPNHQAPLCPAFSQASGSFSNAHQHLKAPMTQRLGPYLSPEQFTAAYTGLLCSEGVLDSLPPTGPVQVLLLGTTAPVALCARALMLPERCRGRGGGSVPFLRGRPPPQATVPCLEWEGHPEAMRLL